jgi:hypothetical protein
MILVRTDHPYLRVGHHMCGVDPAAVKEAIGEVVGEAPTWTQWWSGKRLMSHRRGPDEDGSMEVIEERARE